MILCQGDVQLVSRPKKKILVVILRVPAENNYLMRVRRRDNQPSKFVLKIDKSTPTRSVGDSALSRARFCVFKLKITMCSKCNQQPKATAFFQELRTALKNLLKIAQKLRLIKQKHHIFIVYTK